MRQSVKSLRNFLDAEAFFTALFSRSFVGPSLPPSFFGFDSPAAIENMEQNSPFLPGSIHIQGTVVEEIKQDLKKRKRVFFLFS